MAVNKIDTAKLQNSIDRLKNLKSEIEGYQVTGNIACYDDAGDVTDGSAEISRELGLLQKSLALLVEKTSSCMEQRKSSVETKEQAHTSDVQA